ncbi:hypothetical protein, partial [Mesorhizobium sp. M0296]|uniref:hypothetical protein n=1 Tax=Mesorhizobium sp. M0296 TaxID=2956931 RepID=UPI0033362A5C
VLIAGARPNIPPLIRAPNGGWRGPPARGSPATTTVIFDGNGIPIGGTTGDNHPANAELLVHTFNFAWSDKSAGGLH